MPDHDVLFIAFAVGLSAGLLGGLGLALAAGLLW